jgi:hypothetical protein
MRTLGKKSKLSFLIGRELEMLCFAPYALYLHFGEHILVTIEGEFEHASENRGVRKYSFPIAGSDLQRLIAVRVRDVDVLPIGGLRLNFANGDDLVVAAKDSPYEAYRIERDGEQIAG